MTVDILYPAFNRREFAAVTIEKLLQHTDWTLVRRLVVYDDSSTDGTDEMLRDAIEDAPVPTSFVTHGLGSPVGVMNSYLRDYGASVDAFAKVDSDIVVCPGWLERLIDVMDANPELEVLGMEPGRAQHALPEEASRGWMGCSHIGGVGLFRTDAFARRPGIPERGRFGWTEHQHRQRFMSGWVVPDLDIFALDLLPFEPWASLADSYIERGWARRWPRYDAKVSARFWEWAFPSQVAA